MVRQHWTMEEFVGKEISRIRTLVGEKGQVIGAVSGGVDSTVCSMSEHGRRGNEINPSRWLRSLCMKLLGPVPCGSGRERSQRFHKVTKDLQVDNGLLRQDEAKIVHKTLTNHFGIQLTVVDASQRFLGN